MAPAGSLARMRKQSPDLARNLTSNPFPDGIEIVPTHAENIAAVAAHFKRGANEVNCPSGRCASSQSRDHLLKKAATSMLNAAVEAKTWASPVQPSRSSRCGQSVGTSMKLARCVQTMFWCSSLA